MAEAYQYLDVDGSARRADPHAMLLAELADFVTRHRPCGQLTGDATWRATCSASDAEAASRSCGG
jgi:hypothetical protein